jgi:EmrB/QacA subfamily drug resistance transporter
MSTPGTSGTSGTSDAADRRRWLALAALALVQFTIVIDNTIVNVALPSIKDELGFTTSGLAWVINGYLLTAGGLLLLGGRISDLAGRRRMFLAGAALFAVASFVCGAAPTAEVLVAARFAQGAGEALASPAALSIIALLFTSPGERAKALGIWGGLAGMGATVGVLLSGVLTDLASWRWIFFINLPFALIALLLVPRLVTESRASVRPRQTDLTGAVLVTTGLIAVVHGLLSATRHDWTSLAVLVPLVGGTLALAAFVLVEHRSAEPLVPLRFFANRTRVSANVGTVFMIGVMAAMFLLLTLYMQDVLNYSPLRTGLAYLPFCFLFVAAVFGSFVLSARLGAKPTLLFAFAVAAAGMALLTRLPVAGSYVTDLLPALLVLAVGFGLGFPGLQTASLHGVSEHDAGLGSGVQTAVQAISNALGIAVFLTVALRRTATELTAGTLPAEAVTSGYRLAFAVGTASLLLGGLIVLAFLRTAAAPAAATPPAEPALAPAHP